MSVLAARAVERLPVEDFGREPEASRVQMSPDGKHLAFLRDHNGRMKLHVTEIGSNQITRLDIGRAGLAEDAAKDVVSFRWVSDHRLIVTTGVWDALYGVMAVDLDGKHEVPISGFEGDKPDYLRRTSFFHEVVFQFYDKEQHVLMLDHHEGALGKYDRPDVLKVATDDGLARTVVKNPGEVANWGFDFDGVARLGILTHEESSGAIYRESEKTPGGQFCRYKAGRVSSSRRASMPVAIGY